VNVQRSSAGIRFWSGTPEGEITAAHDSGQVLMFQGKIGPDSRAFTSKLAEGWDANTGLMASCPNIQPYYQIIGVDSVEPGK
jgi:hypothetical protein